MYGLIRCQGWRVSALICLAAITIACDSDSPTASGGGIAERLFFSTPPASVEGNVTIAPAIQVEIRDRNGNRVAGATNAVTLALASNPGDGTLSGTLTVSAVDGVATFSSVLLDRPGTGYAIAAIASNLTGTTSEPFDVSVTFVSVEAGGGRDNSFARMGDHTCGVTTTGSVYCWGGNGKGQIGDGSTTRRLTPALAQAPAGVTFSAVSAGWRHVCALTASPAGQVYCWGRNEDGRLGDGTEADRAVPGPVMMPPGITFTSVSAGGQHTCALASNGSAWCWGRNNFQLGDSTNTQRLTPVRVAAPTGITFSAIAAGNQHNCAVTAGGDAYCWGTNGNGRLGDGTTVSKNHPVRVLPAAPIQFAGVTAGEFHSCGWTSAGAASCWGRNDNGQLGDNSVIQRLLPTAVAGALSFASLTAGNEHTCGRTSAGAVHCWGKNAYGQLGDGTLVNKLVPTAVLGSLSLGITSAGSQHTCGFTSGASAGIWCWGLNEDGQLGDGTVITRLQATRTVH